MLIPKAINNMLHSYIP